MNCPNPVCSLVNREDTMFCERCGTAIQRGAGAVGAPPVPYEYGQPPAPPAGYAAASAGYQDPRYRGAPMVQGEYSGSGRMAIGKDPTAALLLSFFFPAAGQLYNGDYKKAFAIWAGYFLVFVLALVTAGVLSILYLGLWIWSLFDAHRVASRKAPLW